MNTQAMKQALEAITYLMAGSYRSGDSGRWDRVSMPKDKALDMGAAAIDALRDAIQQAESEPVLTVEKEPDYWSGGHFYEGKRPHIDPTKVWDLPIGTKLYTHPAPGVPDDVVRDAISTVREQYRGTDWGKAAECICDAIDAAMQKGGE